MVLAWCVRTFSKMAVVLLLFYGSVASSNTYVLVTVDVESYSAGNPSKQIWGEFQGVPDRWGITKIMDILEDSSAKGTFYLNVYEIAKHGEAPIKEAAQTIVERNHDLQLHTHPEAMFGISGLAKADYQTQKHILETGISYLEKWTAKDIIAHRAGAYQANELTLNALNEIGLQVDSSLSVASESPLALDGYTKNTIQVIHDVIQFPVTYYDQIRLGDWSSRRIVDIEASSLRELKEILNQSAESGLCSVNIMMHSFSLSRYGKPDQKVAERLDKIMKYVDSHPKLKAVTTSEMHKLFDSQVCENEKHFVPHTGIWLTYLRAVEDFEKGTANKVVSIIGPIFVLIGLFLIVFVSRLLVFKKK